MDPLQLLVSAVGAIAGVIAACFAWKGYSSNQSQLRSVVKFNRLGDKGSELTIKVTNHGHRPTFVEEIRLVHSKGSIPYSAYFPGMKELPLHLDEGEPATFFIPILDSQYQSDIQEIARVKSIVVKDSRGRECRFPGWSISKLLAWNGIKNQLKKVAKEITD